MHALLLAVGNQTGHPVLINTSFNTKVMRMQIHFLKKIVKMILLSSLFSYHLFKGQPLVNTITRSLQMMRDYPDLDAVIIENYLFLKE